METTFRIELKCKQILSVRMKVCGDTELAGEQSRGTWFDSKICYKITGQVTALDCKSSLNTNCRIGLAVRGFESLPAHTNAEFA